MKVESLSVDFTDEQKRYLEGFSSGLQISRVGRGFGGTSARPKVDAEPTGPEAASVVAAFERSLRMAGYLIQIKKGRFGLERDRDGAWYVTNQAGAREWEVPLKGPNTAPPARPKNRKMASMIKGRKRR